jgi:hypothetical protein
MEERETLFVIVINPTLSPHFDAECLEQKQKVQRLHESFLPYAFCFQLFKSLSSKAFLIDVRQPV